MENINLWTALITPMNPDNSVDYLSLEKLIHQQAQANNGLLILGSTGEALNLSLEVKKEIIEFVIEQKPKTKIMVGVSGHELVATKQWISYLNTLAVDCYLCVTPLYAKPGFQGQKMWFKECLDISEKPVVLYNVPGRTGVKLDPRVIQELHSHKNLWGLKEASGNLEEFKEYKKAMQDKKVFCGDDALMSQFAKNGSCGLISVASNVWPSETHQYVKRCLNQDLQDIKLWEDACNSLFQVSNPIPVKALLYKLKRINHPNLILPLTHKELVSTSIQEQAHTNISAWYKENN